MDLVVISLWGLLTGCILLGSYAKKPSDIAIDATDLASKVEAVEEKVVKTTQEITDQPIVVDFTSKVKPAQEAPAAKPAISAAKAPIIAAMTAVSETKTLVLDEPEEVVATEGEVVTTQKAMTPYLQKVDGTPATHVLQRGETLTKVANDYFNDMRFWPYIYEVNKDKIESPNKIKADMEILLPNPFYFDINADDPDSIEKAKNFLSK